MQQLDVIIIGAGISGIYSAKKLIEAGKSVLLIEARDRIGGRLYTKKIYGDLSVDLGGQWIGPTQDNMYAIVKEYNATITPAYFEGKSIIALDKKRKTYKGLIPPLALPSLLNLDWAIKKINRLAQTVNLDAPWNTPNAKQLDSITLHNWMLKNIKFHKARSIFTIAAETVFATSIADISLLHALVYIKAGNDFDCLINVEGGAQQDKIMGGVQPLLEKMIAPFYANLRLSQPVEKIIQKENSIEVKCATQSFHAKKVMITVPPAALENICFEPELPVNKKQFISRSFMGSAIKCYAIYKTPFWRKQRLNGMASQNRGYISVTFDNTNPNSEYGILMGFVVGDKAKDFVNFTKGEQEKIIKEELTYLFGEAAQHPLKVYIEAWTTERWTNGCYSGMLPTNVWTSVGKAWRQPIGDIHWAGTETSERWQGYMEGGIIAAKRAVKEILEET